MTRQVGKERSSRSFRVKPVAVNGIDAVVADTALSFGRHTHDQFGLGLIDRGAQVSLSGRGTVEAGTGDIITVNPGEVHVGRPIGSDGRAWRMLYFEPYILSDIFHDMTEGRMTTFEFPHPVLRNEAVADKFRLLFASVTVRPQSTQVEEHMFRVLAQLVEDRTTVCIKRSPPEAIAIARRKIDEDPAASHGLEDLARLCGMSRFQVLRGFTKATGLTPHAYIIQRRLQMARRLVAEGVELAEAAASSGFADQSHMTRLFVRTYGMSPGSYAMARR